MSFAVRYTKAQYLAKITELEGYYNQLSGHLTRMENLQGQIDQFWQDENARQTYMALSKEIRQVRSAMNRTQDMLTLHKSTVEKLDGANLSVGSSILDALGILDKLGV